MRRGDIPFPLPLSLSLPCRLKFRLSKRGRLLVDPGSLAKRLILDRRSPLNKAHLSVKLSKSSCFTLKVVVGTISLRREWEYPPKILLLWRKPSLVKVLAPAVALVRSSPRPLIAESAAALIWRRGWGWQGQRQRRRRLVEVCISHRWCGWEQWRVGAAKSQPKGNIARRRSVPAVPARTVPITLLIVVSSTPEVTFIAMVTVRVARRRREKRPPAIKGVVAGSSPSLPEDR